MTIDTKNAVWQVNSSDLRCAYDCISTNTDTACVCDRPRKNSQPLGERSKMFSNLSCFFRMTLDLKIKFFYVLCIPLFFLKIYTQEKDIFMDLVHKK